MTENDNIKEPPTTSLGQTRGDSDAVSVSEPPRSPFALQDLEEFDRLAWDLSSINNLTRILARLDFQKLENRFNSDQLHQMDKITRVKDWRERYKSTS